MTVCEEGARMVGGRQAVRYIVWVGRETTRRHHLSSLPPMNNAAGIVQALNYAITKTGCTKNQAISMVVLTLVETGIALPKALDAVLGAGTYRMISDTTWELLQDA